MLFQIDISLLIQQSMKLKYGKGRDNGRALLYGIINANSQSSALLAIEYLDLMYCNGFFCIGTDGVLEVCT